MLMRLEVVERVTRAQAQLIEDLLDMSRVVTGHLRLDVRKVDLQGVIQGGDRRRAAGGGSARSRLSRLRST